MVDAKHIERDFEVKASDGKHIGTVEGTENGRVRMSAGGTFHEIDMDLVDSVEKGVVRLNTTSEETAEVWR